ncbi:hypothetical protein [Mycoplasma mycoides]|uniref:hypothetical protein n=1 Tax=Mycoplasma mycoides TaxID=2102 RepID=UPI002240CB81|nr:hypothetical protein [Mycoplasma mycoides]QVK04958.1 hypothetical protein I7640_02845 [Mycoplasma mycoides subsp. capri]
MRLYVKLFFLIVVLTFIFFEYSYFIDNFIVYALKNDQESNRFILSTKSVHWVFEWNKLLGTNLDAITPISKWQTEIIEKGYKLTGYIYADSFSYQILDKFKFFWGSLIIYFVISFWKLTVWNEVKGIINYLKNRNKYISVEYSKTIQLLKKLVMEIKKNNVVKINKICLSYDKLIFKPIFLSRLIEDIQLDLITEEQNIVSYINAAENVLNLLEKMYEKEKLKIKNSGKSEELSSGIIMGFRYFSTRSSYYNKYCSSIKNESNTIEIVSNYNTKLLPRWFINLIYVNVFLATISLLIIILFKGSKPLNVFDNSSTRYISFLILVAFSTLLFIFCIFFKVKTKIDFSLKTYLRKEDPEYYNRNKIVKNYKFILGACIFLLFSTSILLLSTSVVSLILFFYGANWLSTTYVPSFLSLILFYFTFLCLLLHGFAALKEIYKYKRYSKKIQWWICIFEFILPFLLCFSIFITHLCFLIYVKDINLINNMLKITSFILFSYCIVVGIYRLFLTNKIISFIKNKT